MSDKTRKVRTPLFPLYSEVRALLPIWDDVAKEHVRKLIKEIWEHTGTPQNPVDWSDPDTWIEQRLSKEHQLLARRIWEGTQKSVNPRHVYGSYLFIYGYDLLAPDSSGRYRLTERGKGFLHEEERVVREIDEMEGISELLAILSTKPHAKRADLLPEWSEFLQTYSRYGTDSTIKDTLRRRLINIVERGFATREGNTFDVTAKGRAYAATSWRGKSEPHQAIMRAIGEYNAAQIEQLKERLGEMSPHRFERLIGELLEAMGYEDVAVVGQAGDRGIDVVGTVQVGITTIREVVQGKRHKNSINRQVVDQLRGALPYHRAIRGTLITLSRFTSGCAEAALFPGAAPITLIDGDRLVKLLIDHEIAVTRREAFLTEVDASYFEPTDEEALVEEETA
jgi:restriction system protein